MAKIREIWDVRHRPGKHIGIEIEMEGENLPAALPRWWSGVGDGSLRGAALEYVLRTPCEREKVLGRLEYLQKYLANTEANLQPSDRCGVHIHVNCQEMTSLQVINFAILYLIFEDILVKWCGEQREGNLFCLRASDADRIIQGLIRCRREDGLNFMQHDEYRYGAINLSAIAKYGSVEFRAMQTPKDFKSINTWAQMLLKVQDASLAYKEPYEIIESASMMGGREFLREVFHEYTKELKCLEMEVMILEGVRRVQEIAYTPVDKKGRLRDMIHTVNWGQDMKVPVPAQRWVPGENGPVEKEPDF